MKNNKILFIITLPPPIHGASTVGENIKNSTLINDAFDCDYINLQTSTKLKETGKPGLSKTISIISLYLNVFSLLIRNRYKFCYINTTASGAGFYKDFIVILILKVFRKKIVHHLHNKGISNSKGWLNKKLYNFAFRNTNIILLSKYLYQDIAQYTLKSKVYYCANGIKILDAESKFNKSTVEVIDEIKPCRFIYLSNMIVQKGAYILLDACKELNNKNIHFECHYIGGWTDITELDFKAKIEEYNLTETVFVHGPKYYDERKEFLKNSDVFVLPTFYHYEAFPLVILEAMRFKLPVISTPEGGISEMVIDGETGFLTTQKNINELSEKMQILIEDPDLRLKMGIAGKKRYRKSFTLKDFEKRMFNILNELMLK